MAEENHREDEHGKRIGALEQVSVDVLSKQRAATETGTAIATNCHPDEKSMSRFR